MTSFRKAWRLLDGGKHIHRACWRTGLHVRYIKPIGYAIYDASGAKQPLDLTGPDRRASDWQEYTS